MTPGLLRIFDANLNRATEGLRLLEDVARFILNDYELTNGFRKMRHALAQSAQPPDIHLLFQRNAERDIGKPTKDTLKKQSLPDNNAEGESKPYAELTGTITANARRAEQALRVMEELSRLPETETVLDTASFARARFELYTLEKKLSASVLRQKQASYLKGLYVILDTASLRGKDVLETAIQVIEGGAAILQLRDKQNSKKDLLPLAQKLQKLCADSGVLFIINDYLDLALASDADGIHIGQDDFPLLEIRKHLPVNKIVGCSAKTTAQAVQAQQEGADYLAIGSIFPSKTKASSTVVGVNALKEIRQAISSPLIAIGGINKDNIGRVMAAGADCAAVIDAVLSADDITKATRELVSIMELITEKKLPQ